MTRTVESWPSQKKHSQLLLEARFQSNVVGGATVMVTSAGGLEDDDATRRVGRGGGRGLARVACRGVPPNIFAN